jgi:hypothetical protein
MKKIKLGNGDFITVDEAANKREDPKEPDGVPSNETVLTYKSESDSIGNDLFWSLSTPCQIIDGEVVGMQILKWSGYNDRNWWDNCEDNARKRREDKLGNVWEIDYHTGDVSLMINKSEIKKL